MQKSTESAISNTVNYIEKFVFKNQYALGVFLDISAAFDSILPEHIKNSLLDHGGDRDLVEWYYGYLKGRDLFVDLQGASIKRTTAMGFPQGGVCSAKFWLIDFNFAIKIINTNNIEGNGYADDCSAVLGGPRVDHLVINMNKMLKSLAIQGRRCGLHFNPEKTVAVLFTRKRLNPEHFIKFEGKIIQYSESVVYLGVTLDSKLHWKVHIQNKINKAKKLIMGISNITQGAFGPCPKIMRWAFTGIVRPMLSYGALVWAHELNNEHLLDKLRKLNRLAINTFTNIPKSTPTRYLEVALDVMPLDLFCKRTAAASYYRLKQHLVFGWEGTYSNVYYSTSHMKYWGTLQETLGLKTEDIDTCSEIIRDNLFRVDRNSFKENSKHIHSEANVYTDGSKMSEHIGAAYVIYVKNKVIKEDNFRLPSTCTVFQAEIKAILLSLIHI